jgi:hypothetical protein
MKSKEQSKVAPVLLLSFIVFFLLILALWTDRNIDFWLTYFKGFETNCPYWLSLIATILGPFPFIFNVLSELARFVF